MKQKDSVLIIVLSLVVAISSLSIGVSANRKRRMAEKETNRLRMQIAQPQTTEKPAPEPLRQEVVVNTNVVAQLEKELAALRAELEAAKKTPPPQREGWEERMERTKEEDPEGYAEMVKNRAERRQAMRYDLAERTANFMELKTEFMTDDERENHELLVEKMSAIWALTEQLQDPEQQPNRESMRELFSAINEARPLMDAERSAMFRQLANDLGFDGEGTEVFSSYIEEIISATTIQIPRGGPGRRLAP
ncbi:MAG: hypothetical protein ABFS02_10240 [Pseudomonadota bacterium]